jgi:hypothetical protein
MLTRYFLGLVALAVPLSLFAQTTFPDKCGSAPLPFSSIEVKHPIDTSCGLEGKSTSSANSKTQNKVKNNLCASGTPETVTPDSLTALQKSTTVPAGQGKEPADRSPLEKLGEGKIVRMKAFLIEAHVADLPSGESVNCSGPTADLNDIHMAMGTSHDTQECASVSAEIIPHYRPATWDQIGTFESWSSSTKKYVGDPAVQARLLAQPYRITGQLFFDSSHQPCPCGDTKCTGDPIRASDWEIHPVYAIEVCKTGTSCNEATDSDWIAFDQWWGAMPPIKKPKKPHTHNPHEPTTPTKKPKKSTTATSGSN